MIVDFQRGSFNIALVAMVNFTDSNDGGDTSNQTSCLDINSNQNASSQSAPMVSYFMKIFYIAMRILPWQGLAAFVTRPCHT